MKIEAISEEIDLLLYCVFQPEGTSVLKLNLC
jgi:hypothetical protein